jgi:predicted DNA-binding transcriptional regulator AlpA
MPSRATGYNRRSSKVDDSEGKRRGPQSRRPGNGNGGDSMTPRDAMWNAHQTAEYLNVSARWVYQHANDGLLPYHRYPGSALMRFDPAEIRGFARGEWKPPLKIA